MFESIAKFFKNLGKKDKSKESSDTAKERLHLVLVQDRANVSADFLELMKQEIIEVIKKYIDVDEKAIDVRLTNQTNDDGTVGVPALYANIPITTIKNEARKANNSSSEKEKESSNKEKLEDKENKEEQEREKKEVSSEIKKNKTENDDTTAEDTKKKTTSSGGANKKKDIKKAAAKTVATKTAAKSKTKVASKTKKEPVKK